VIAHTDNGEGLLTLVTEHRPELAIVDIRLPPTFRDEGIRAAITARALQPGLGVLILSQYVEPVYMSELLDSGGGGVGYLLKERVGDVREFVDAAERVATGGTALDREVVSELLQVRESRHRTGGSELDGLSAREREVLALMAEGRSNAAIGRALVISQGAVEKHISNIFAKLTLPAADDSHRRVLAVVAYLRATG
jgi:DNA-binding NarL/FixJ family response regulator